MFQGEAKLLAREPTIGIASRPFRMINRITHDAQAPNECGFYCGSLVWFRVSCSFSYLLWSSFSYQYKI